MSEPPPATIGALIKNARDRVVPKLTIEAAARRAGKSSDYWGAIENDSARSRTGKPIRVSDQTLVSMLTVIPLLPEDVEILERLRPEAAALLARQGTPGPRAVTSVPGPSLPSADDDDAAIEDWLAHRAPKEHREVLGWIWSELGPDGRPTPRGARFIKMLDWLLYSAPGRERGTG